MYRETRVSLSMWTKVVFMLWQTVQVSSVDCRVTPSLILRPPSSSAPACDSGWSLHEKKQQHYHHVRGIYIHLIEATWLTVRIIENVERQTWDFIYIWSCHLLISASFCISVESPPDLLQIKIHTTWLQCVYTLL